MSNKKVKVSPLTVEDVAQTFKVPIQKLNEVCILTGREQMAGHLDIKCTFSPCENVVLSSELRALAFIEQAIKQHTSYQFHFTIKGYEDNTKPTDQ